MRFWPQFIRKESPKSNERGYVTTRPHASKPRGFSWPAREAEHRGGRVAPIAGRSPYSVRRRLNAKAQKTDLAILRPKVTFIGAIKLKVPVRFSSPFYIASFSQLAVFAAAIGSLPHKIPELAFHCGLVIFLAAGRPAFQGAGGFQLHLRQYMPNPFVIIDLDLLIGAERTFPSLSRQLAHPILIRLRKAEIKNRLRRGRRQRCPARFQHAAENSPSTVAWGQRHNPWLFAATRGCAYERSLRKLCLGQGIAQNKIAGNQKSPLPFDTSAETQLTVWLVLFPLTTTSSRNRLLSSSSIPLLLGKKITCTLQGAGLHR